VFGFTGTSFAWLTKVGPDRGKATVMVDGKTLATTDLYAPLAAVSTKTFSGLKSAAHTVTIQVTGTKNAAASAAGVVLDGFKVGTTVTQESASNVVLSDWRSLANSAASGGTMRLNKVANGSVTLVFTGVSVDWIAAKGPAYGRAKVLIDGVTVVSSVDLYASTQKWQQDVMRSPTLVAGRHTLTLQVLGTKTAAATAADVPVDAFVARS
jgi:hypothetical protein